MAGVRLESRPWFCIRLSRFQVETGDVGQRPRRIIRAKDRNLGDRNWRLITAAWEKIDSGSGIQGQIFGWPFVLVSTADLKSINMTNSSL